MGVGELSGLSGLWTTTQVVDDREQSSSTGCGSANHRSGAVPTTGWRIIHRFVPGLCTTATGVSNTLSTAPSTDGFVNGRGVCLLLSVVSARVGRDGSCGVGRAGGTRFEEL